MTTTRLTCSAHNGMWPESGCATCWLINDLYGAGSPFTPEEQGAMRQGYTRRRRIEISGLIYGGYPQAISMAHADKIDAHWERYRVWAIALLPQEVLA